jgi:hypothetical protein
MKRAVVLGAALCLSGCLYDQPLAPGAAEPLDPAVMGAWKCVNPDGDEVETLTVGTAADRRYRVGLAGGEDKPSVFTAYPVTFESQKVVNIQEVVDGQARKWTLVRYTLHRPTVLHVEFAHHEPFEGAATAEQRLKVLREELKEGRLFGDFCVCIRAAQK